MFKKRFLKYTSILPEYLEKKRTKFTPETTPELLSYDEYTWKKVFPYKNDVDYSKYQLSNIGKYSIFYPNDADKTARIIKSFFKSNEVVITDANANMGGATIAFTKYFKKVNAVEIIEFHCDILKNNLNNYGTLDQVKIYCNDYLDVADKIFQDAIFFDPPWGGPNYKRELLLNMYLDNINIKDIIYNLINKVKLIAIRVPYNYDFKKLLEITDKSHIFTFKKPNGRLNYFLIILLSKNFF